MAYCHDSVGIGHLRRTLAICDRVGSAFPSASFIIATGAPFVGSFELAQNVDFIKLPALRKNDCGEYDSKLVALPLQELIECRQRLLVEAARTFKPDVLLVDKAPVGVVRELVPTLRFLATARPDTRIVFGMRDVEDEPDATIAQWTANGVQEVLEEYYDEIWVYGMREIYDVAEQYRLSERIRRKLRYMGFISRPVCPHTPAQHENPSVLVTVGGGTDGYRVLKSYLEGGAQIATNLGAETVMVGGPDLPRVHARELTGLARQAPRVRWSDFEGCMCCRMRQADWIVTMGGYNTLCELARLRKPALVAPRTTPRLEQKIRAELWQKRGVVRMLDPGHIDANGMAAAVGDLIRNAPAVADGGLDLSGLDRVEAQFRNLWTGAPHANPLRM